jgi:hypothetical protein
MARTLWFTVGALTGFTLLYLVLLIGIRED